MVNDGVGVVVNDGVVVNGVVVKDGVGVGVGVGGSVTVGGEGVGWVKGTGVQWSTSRFNPLSRNGLRRFEERTNVPSFVQLP